MQVCGADPVGVACVATRWTHKEPFHSFLAMCATPFRTDRRPPSLTPLLLIKHAAAAATLPLRCRDPPLSPHRSEYRCREFLQAMKQLLFKARGAGPQERSGWRWWLLVGHTRPQQDCCLLCGVIGSCAGRIGSQFDRAWGRERGARRRGGSGAEVKPERSAGPRPPT